MLVLSCLSSAATVETALRMRRCAAGVYGVSAERPPIAQRLGTPLALWHDMQRTAYPHTTSPRAGRQARARLRVLAVLLMLTVACKGDGGGAVGPNPVIAGQWEGTAKAGLVRFNATFTQDVNAVGGTGTFTSPLGGSDFTVDGTLEGANMVLLLTSASIGATTFRGRFIAKNRIQGILERPADEDLELTLDRK